MGVVTGPAGVLEEVGTRAGHVGSTGASGALTPGPILAQSGFALDPRTAETKGGDATDNVRPEPETRFWTPGFWRDLIDLVTLWKRKCLREGFITEDWDQPVADWKAFFFLCSLRRNLLRNPCAEEDMTSWQIDSNGGNQWRVESLPGDHGTDFPDSKVKKYFVTSFEMCLKSQLVDLKAEGYWDELLDTFRPEIEVKDWFAARADCGCTYHIRVHLVSDNYIVLASFEPPPVTIHQWNNAKWTEVSHTFSDYPPGVRHILFQHGGKDTQFWAGWYGPRITNSSIIISPKMTRDPAPSTAQPETMQGAGVVRLQGGAESLGNSQHDRHPGSSPREAKSTDASWAENPSDLTRPKHRF
uniref:F-box protein 6 n=1 Tax=Ursus maritimus TaxID=29073 RepID=A0A452VDM0_URSMA